MPEQGLGDFAGLDLHHPSWYIFVMSSKGIQEGFKGIE